MASYTNTLMSNTDKLMDLLDEKNEVLDKPDAEELFKCTGHIEFDNGEDEAWTDAMLRN